MKLVGPLLATASLIFVAAPAYAFEPTTAEPTTESPTPAKPVQPAQPTASTTPEPGGQNAPDTDDDDEIIVTAEKFAQSVQKAPVSVTVIDEQALHDMGAASFQDYASTVPSLSFMALAPGEQRILLRGVSDGVDTTLRGATQNVTGVYIDDMVVSNNYTSPDLNLFDVDRIEVLKGPQGTLYGDGSVGGLIRVITNKADASGFSAAAEGTAGAIRKGGGDYALNGMINVPLVDDKLALRAVGQFRRNEGFIDDIIQNNKNVNTITQYGGSASLLWTPVDRFSLTLNGLYQRTKLGGGSDYNLQLGDLKRGTIFRETLDTEFTLLNGVAELDFDWASLSASTSYGIFDREGVGDFTDFLSTIFPVALPSRNDHGNHSKTFSEEIRLVSPSDRNFHWILGLYYLHFREFSFEHDQSVGLFDFFRDAFEFPLEGTPFDVGQDIIFKGDGVRKRRVFAGFGEGTYDITSSLSATIGARWFNDRLSDEETVGGVVTDSPQTTLNQATEENGWVFRFRLADQITDDILVYGIASEGYRTGGLNPLNPATINDPTFPAAFEPDSLWNYELGWKTRFFDKRLTVNGAAYYIDWNNIQVQVGLPSGFSIIANAGKAIIKGLELETALRVTDSFDIGFNGSLIDAKLARTTAELGDKGDRLTGVPKSQFSGHAQWTFPIGAMEGFVRGDFQRVGKITRFFRTPDVDPYGDYTLLNARLGIRRDDLEITAFIKNIGDKRAAVFRGAQATSSPEGRVDLFVVQPRTIGLTISKRFR